MFGNSSPVTSNQGNAPHRRLHAVVTRHVQKPFLKPVADYSKAAFESSMKAWNNARGLPLILDAGCGTGLSTRHLAAWFPDHFVVGIDQSAHRLGRTPDREGTPQKNWITVRADLVDYWRLLQSSGVVVARQYLLYPNPWPKAAHMGRRWHTHPVFPAMVALGGFFECRSNWRVYVEECAIALRLLEITAVEWGRHTPSAPITPFESKYLASGHELWRCTAQLPVPGAARTIENP